MNTTAIAVAVRVMSAEIIDPRTGERWSRADRSDEQVYADLRNARHGARVAADVRRRLRRLLAVNGHDPFDPAAFRVEVEAFAAAAGMLPGSIWPGWSEAASPANSQMALFVA